MLPWPRMKLGEMLVRDGRVTETQLRDALDRQRRDGGRLGTVLCEMGVVDLETLTVYLGLELGIPIATGATLERAKKHAVRLLTPQQALRSRCIPIIVQDRQLIAAIDDPHDLVGLDELARATSYRIIPRVAPEIRIFYYLERYYGVPRPERFRAFGDTPRGNSRPTTDLPAPPLPGLPPPVDAPISAPTPAPVLRARPPKIKSDAHKALEIEAEDLLTELEADDTARAEAAANARAAEERARQANAQRSAAASDDDEEVARHLTEATAPGELERARPVEPMALEDAILHMRQAEQRGDVAHAIMAYAASVFDIAALCVVRDNMAFGWMARGGHVDNERIEALLIPLDTPSMFQTALQRDTAVLHEAPVPATLHSYLYKVLRCEEPHRATVAVVQIGRRVVNILYGHRVAYPDLSPIDLDSLDQVCAAATEAYVRLIARNKKPSKRRPVMVIETARGGRGAQVDDNAKTQRVPIYRDDSES